MAASSVNSHRFHCGLVVGKFAPLHRGHQLLLDTCQSQCDEVIVISWLDSTDGFAGFETERRRDWLTSLYPNARVVVLDDSSLADWAERTGRRVPKLPMADDDALLHRRFCGWVCTAMLDRRVDAVFTSEDYGDAFAEVLTRWFRAHLFGVMPVRHVCVDAARELVPVSGSALRTATREEQLPWLDPIVAASQVRRIAILGGESSGKSTLTHALAEALGTVPVDEYGRELWDARGGTLDYTDLLAIAQEQVRRETIAARTPAAITSGCIVCDTSPLTTLLYCLDMFERAEPELISLADRAYDLVVLCDPDFDFVQDGTRRDDVWRQRQHEWYQRELQTRAIPHQTVGGSVSERVEAIATNLRKMQ